MQNTSRAGSSAAPRRRTGAGTSVAERLIAGVPARIMRPRLVFLTCLVALVAFGLLMVYSASSVEAQATYGSSTYFLGRQALFAVIGAVGAAFIVFMPDAWFTKRTLLGYLVVMVLLLGLVAVIGRGSRGATRWLSIAGIQFQPSEFLKLGLIPMVAIKFDELYSARIPDTSGFFFQMGIMLVFTLGPIFLQPDFGTVLILAVTIYFMAAFAGAKGTTLGGIAAGILLACVLALILEPYRLTRIEVALNPWLDEYGDGYQATLAIMAFASGGLFGRGIGNSTMKYSYLPEAHNDYILAIIGEELGFILTLVFFAVFALMIWSSFKIAEQATNRRSALTAAGCGVVLAVQFLINALGILNVFPMTGKPLPFISYGGSSIIVSICLAGLILRVSRESAQRDQYERRRESFAVMDESTAGEPLVRGGGAPRAGFTVLAGSRGAQARPTPRSRGASSGGGYQRIDLNSDPSARLRTDEGPQVRRDYHDR